MSTPPPGKIWTDPPPVEQYTYGLLSVAAVTTGDGPWQIGGVEYDSDACAQGGYVLGSCPQPVPTTGQSGTITATPSPTGATVALGEDADTAIWYALVPTGGAPVTGVLAPGSSETVLLPPGTYTFQAQAYLQPVESSATAVTVPGGSPVSLEVTVAGVPGGGTTHDKPVAEGLNHVEGGAPFTVYARSECNAVGFEDPMELARRRVAMIENREVEHYFSRYVLGAVGARLPLGGEAVGIKQALGALEADAALYYGGQPVLHAPRWANPYFEDRHLLQPNRDTRPLLRTYLESRVAFGGGYYDNPFNPAEAPDAGFWLVATGQVRAWRSAVFGNETFTTATNLRAAIAERTYLLDSDCYRAAVLVDLTGEG